MGAKTWMLVYADVDAREALKAAPKLDRVASLRVANQLFPGDKLKSLADGDLSDTCPPDNELCIGCFPGVSIIAAKEFGIDLPSTLAPSFIAASPVGTISLHAMHSVVDWFAFAQWKGGRLIRSLSLSSDGGLLEDIGTRLAFEEPYWAGDHADFGGNDFDGDEEAEYPFPFHPLDLGEAALNAMFGYQLEGAASSTLIAPESIPLMRFERSHSRWNF